MQLVPMVVGVAHTACQLAAGAPIHRAELPRMATDSNRPGFLSYPAPRLDQDKWDNVHVDPQGTAINAFGARHVHAHRLCDLRRAAESSARTSKCTICPDLSGHA